MSLEIWIYLGFRTSSLEITTMKVIILAGGKGTRLPDSANNIPKVLVEVAGRPILAHQLARLRAQGFNNIRLSLGYRAGDIVDWLKRNRETVEYVIEKESRGTGGAIKYAAEDLAEPFLVLNGDILADFDFMAAKNAGGKHGNVISGRLLPDARDMGLLVVDRYSNAITSFLEKPGVSRPGIINAGVYVLHPELFRNMPESFSIEHQLFPRLVSENNLFHVSHAGEYWFDCGTEERLRTVRGYFLRRQL